MTSKTLSQRGFGRIALVAGAAAFAVIGIGFAIQPQPADSPKDPQAAAQALVPQAIVLEAPQHLPQMDEAAEAGGNVFEYN